MTNDTDIKEVRSAIARLTAQLEHTGHSSWAEYEDSAAGTHYVSQCNTPVASHMTLDYAEMIVMLRRTASAQLEVMQMAEDMGVAAGGEGWAALTLARAINNGYASRS